MHIHAKSLQWCLTLCGLWTVARQAPLSRGILQEKIPQWVALLLSRASSQSRNCILFCGSCMAGGFFTSTATWEALYKETGFNKLRGKEWGEFQSKGEVQREH